MKKHVRTQRIKCNDCGHEFWSKYHCGPDSYATEKSPRCGKCGSDDVTHIGYRE